MLQASDHDFIAGVPIMRDRAADVRCQRGHVVAKDDLFRAGRVIEICHRSMRFIQNGSGFLAGGERAAVIGIVLGQASGNAVERLPGDLGTARVGEENHALVLQGRKLAARCFLISPNRQLALAGPGSRPQNQAGGQLQAVLWVVRCITNGQSPPAMDFHTQVGSGLTIKWLYGCT